MISLESDKQEQSIYCRLSLRDVNRGQHCHSVVINGNSAKQTQAEKLRSTASTIQVSKLLFRCVTLVSQYWLLSF